MRRLQWRRVLLTVFAIVLLCTITERHVWRWAWADGPFANYNLRTVQDANGRERASWRWVVGREIRCYTLPQGDAFRDLQYVSAIQDLVESLGLDLRVRLLAAPPRVLTAIARSTRGARRAPPVDFDRLCAELNATRDGGYAEVVLMPCVLDRDPEVTGFSDFTQGVAVVRADRASIRTARHEAAHLLGYHLHDNWPVFIFGYPNPWVEEAFFHTELDEGLMMPTIAGSTLSPRARDAILVFWRRLERETGESYCVP